MANWAQGPLAMGPGPISMFDLGPGPLPRTTREGSQGRGPRGGVLREGFIGRGPREGSVGRRLFPKNTWPRRMLPARTAAEPSTARRDDCSDDAMCSCAIAGAPAARTLRRMRQGTRVRHGRGRVPGSVRGRAAHMHDHARRPLKECKRSEAPRRCTRLAVSRTKRAQGRAPRA